jgi:H/ACA ribonucleoprotein complex subunit 4
VAFFAEDETLVTLHDIMDAHVFWQEDGDDEQLRRVIMPMERGLTHLSKIVIRDSTVDAICHGADLAMPGVLKLSSCIKVGDVVAVFSLKGEAVATGMAHMSSEQMAGCDEGIAVKTKRVFMEPGTYPKMWTKKIRV